jgi:hypothetical protein
MTEAEWLSCASAWEMVRFIRGRTGKVSLRYRLGAERLERKQRLFLAACCRRIWPLLSDARSRRAVEVAERYADRAASGPELQAAHAAAAAAYHEAVRMPRTAAALATEAAAAVAQVEFALHGFNICMRGMDVAANAPAARTASPDAPLGYDPDVLAGERAAQTGLVRDVFGNPLRPVQAEGGWLTTDVRGLASGIYEEQAYDRLPILADALQDAGCADPDVLDHCRNSGPHVRGCWVVDLLLGKE